MLIILLIVVMTMPVLAPIFVAVATVIFPVTRAAEIGASDTEAGLCIAIRTSILGIGY